MSIHVTLQEHGLIQMSIYISHLNLGRNVCLSVLFALDFNMDKHQGDTKYFTPLAVPNLLANLDELAMMTHLVPVSVPDQLHHC